MHRAFPSTALFAGEAAGQAEQCGEGIKSPTFEPKVVQCVGGADVREGNLLLPQYQFSFPPTQAGIPKAFYLI